VLKKEGGFWCKTKENHHLLKLSTYFFSFVFLDLKHRV
jgi:hypothetical protein